MKRHGKPGAKSRITWLLRGSGKSPVRYTERDKLEVEIRLYIKGTALTMHDLDNLLKDILDALQGLLADRKNRRALEPIIPNDRQIYRVIMEKGAPPWQSKGLGHLTIRKFRAWKFTRRVCPERLKTE